MKGIHRTNILDNRFEKVEEQVQLQYCRYIIFGRFNELFYKGTFYAVKLIDTQL